MLRYHNWLPVTLEPAYADGYTCDDCGKDFFSGPMFHEKESGVDFCVPCGERSGLSPFASLVSTLYFPSTATPLADSKTQAFVLFAFAFSLETYGYFFSDSSCITLSQKASEAAPHRVQVRRAMGENEPLTVAEAATRMPWVSQDIRESHFIAVELHPLPQRTPTDELFVANFHADTELVHITLSDGCTQHFDSAEGIEIVTIGTTLIAAFDGAQPWSGTHERAVEASRRLLDGSRT